jgi:hypothetical protein
MGWSMQAQARLRELMIQTRNFAMSKSCPKRRGELLSRRILANQKMVNRVGRQKSGVPLWQL